MSISRSETLTHNPFEIPGMEGRPHQPLRPWAVETQLHHDYYVDIDNTDEQLNQFLRKFGELRYATRSGRLVVVNGEDGSGKSSLINRCVARVVPAGSSVDPRTIVVDLTQSQPPESEPLERRMFEARRSLLLKLKTQIRLSDEVQKALVNPTDTRAVYELLSSSLAEPSSADGGQGLVVLLPGTDLSKEIVEYSHCVQPGLVFFIEHSGRPRDLEAELDMLRDPSPIVLSVGSLKDGDCLAFVRNRLKLFSEELQRRHDGSGVTPTIRETAMTKLSQDRQRLTLRELQRVLYEVFEAHLASTRANKPVEYRDISRFFVQQGFLP
jgi:hypothetical protein